MAVYVNSDRTHFGFILNQKCYQDFNETILETLSMSEKALPYTGLAFLALFTDGGGGKKVLPSLKPVSNILQ